LEIFQNLGNFCEKICARPENSGKSTGKFWKMSQKAANLTEISRKMLENPGKFPKKAGKFWKFYTKSDKLEIHFSQKI